MGLTDYLCSGVTVLGGYNTPGVSSADGRHTDKRRMEMALQDELAATRSGQAKYLIRAKYYGFLRQFLWL